VPHHARPRGFDAHALLDALDRLRWDLRALHAALNPRQRLPPSP